MKESNEKLLLREHPELYRQYKLSPAETCMCWGIAVGDGWFGILPFSEVGRFRCRFQVAMRIFGAD